MQVGDTVRHRVWGEGIVRRIEGNEVTVGFVSAGKPLVLAVLLYDLKVLHVAESSKAELPEIRVHPPGQQLPHYLQSCPHCEEAEQEIRDIVGKTTNLEEQLDKAKEVLERMEREGYEAEAKAAAIDEVLRSDPVAQYKIRKGTRLINPILSMLDKHGSWPETLTKAEAESLSMGRKFGESSFKKTYDAVRGGRAMKRIEWAYVIDELAEHFNMSQQDLIDHAVGIWEMKQKRNKIAAGGPPPGLREFVSATEKEVVERQFKEPVYLLVKGVNPYWWSMDELRRMAASSGLSAAGSKDELIRRLKPVKVER